MNPMSSGYCQNAYPRLGDGWVAPLHMRNICEVRLAVLGLAWVCPVWYKSYAYYHERYGVAKPMAFEILIERVRVGDELEHEQFTELSDLPPSVAHSLVDALATLEAEKRREFTLQLISTANDDVSMDFNQVFIALIRDADYIIRSLAISGLWECERSSLVGDFIAIIGDDSSDTVRISAAIALGRFVMLAANGKLDNTYTERLELALMDAMDHSDLFDDLWRHCLEAVAPLSAEWITAAIKQALVSEEYLLRISGLQAVSRSAEEAWLPWILGHLKDPENSVRAKAAEACGELGSDEAVLYLLPLVHDESTEVRLTAIKSLATIGGDFVNKILLEQQDSEDEVVAEFAKRVLNGEEFEEDTML